VLQDHVKTEEPVIKLEILTTLFVIAHQIGKESSVKTLWLLVIQLVIVEEHVLREIFVLTLQDTIAISHLFAMGTLVDNRRKTNLLSMISND